MNDDKPFQPWSERSDDPEVTHIVGTGGRWGDNVEAWDLLVDLLRDEAYVRDCTGVSSDALDACLANDVLRAEVER